MSISTLRPAEGIGGYISPKDAAIIKEGGNYPPVTLLELEEEAPHAANWAYGAFVPGTGILGTANTGLYSKGKQKAVVYGDQSTKHVKGWSLYEIDKNGTKDILGRDQYDWVHVPHKEKAVASPLYKKAIDTWEAQKKK